MYVSPALRRWPPPPPQWYGLIARRPKSWPTLAPKKTHCEKPEGIGNLAADLLVAVKPLAISQGLYWNVRLLGGQSLVAIRAHWHGELAIAGSRILHAATVERQTTTLRMMTSKRQHHLWTGAPHVMHVLLGDERILRIV